MKPQIASSTNDNNSPSRGPGRPSIYSLEVARKICELLGNNLRSLRWICLQPGMPARTTVYTWLNENPDFRAMYKIAREEQLEFIAEEIIRIADDASNDWIKDEDGKMVPNRQAIARSKLQIGVRQWLLSHILPAKYRGNSSARQQSRQPVRSRAERDNHWRHGSKPLTTEEFEQRMKEAYA